MPRAMARSQLAIARGSGTRNWTFASAPLEDGRRSKHASHDASVLLMRAFVVSTIVAIDCSICEAATAVAVDEHEEGQPQKCETGPPCALA